MKYQKFEIENEYIRFMEQIKEKSEKDFRKKVLLPQLKNCIKHKNILRIDIGNYPIANRTLDEVFANLMRENKIDYNTLLTHLDFKGNECVIQDILDMLAKTKQELEFVEMEKPTIKERLFKLLPTILQYLIRDIISFLKAKKEGRQLIVPLEIADYRMEQCKKCKNLSSTVLGVRCKICGCFLKFKTQLSFEHCTDLENMQWDEWFNK